MSKPINMTDDAMDAGVPLRERYERFCGHFVESRNPMQAFRLAFVVDRGKATQWVHEQAARLMKDPAVMQRIQQMRDDAAAQTVVTVQEIIQDLHDIATADPNELVSVVYDCCRHCHGVDGAFQWSTEREYAKALEAAMRKTVPPGQPPPELPSAEGGFGFHPSHAPNPLCAECFGVGVKRETVHNTTKVSAKARKLYAGMKKGDVVIHDQVKVREMLGRVLGAFRDGIPVTPATANTAAIAAGMDEATAGRTYLQVIQGGKG